MIKIGCAGFPVRQSLVVQNLQFVEIGDSAGRRPKDTTLKKWRAAAPAQFEFVVRAPQVWIDPVRLSGLRWNGNGGKRSLTRAGSPESELRRLKHELNARLVVLELPSHFHPTPDRISRVQTLIRHVPDTGFSVVWRPPKSWSASLVDQLTRSMKLAVSSNPLQSASAHKSPFHYFRIGGAPGTKFSDDNLKTIKRACAGKLSYVVFDVGPTSYYEAVRFSRFVKEGEMV